jgi:hypothetical protein
LNEAKVGLIGNFLDLQKSRKFSLK